MGAMVGRMPRHTRNVRGAHTDKQRMIYFLSQFNVPALLRPFRMTGRCMLGRLVRMPHVQARLPNNISCQPTLRLHQNRARRIGYNCVLNSQTEGYHFPHDIEKKERRQRVIMAVRRAQGGGWSQWVSVDMRGWYGNSNGTEGGRLKRKARRWKDEGLDDLRMMMKRVLLFLLYIFWVLCVSFLEGNGAAYMSLVEFALASVPALCTLSLRDASDGAFIGVCDNEVGL